MLTFTTDTTNLIITGASYLVGDILAGIGGVSTKSGWLLPIDQDTADFRYGLELASQRAFKLRLEKQALEEKARKDEYNSPENQKKLSDAMVAQYLKIKKRSGGTEYSQICCASCQLVGLNPENVICSVHPSRD